MVTQNGKSFEHITNFFLHLMRICFANDPKADEVTLIKSYILSHNVLSLNAKKSVGHQTTK